MAKRNSKFDGIKVIAKPVRIKFKTKSGKTVYLNAIRTFEQKKVVRSRA